MTPLPRLVTDRLLLRRWRAEDRRPFAALNADPLVTEFLPGPLTQAESDALIDRSEESFERNGFGLWAVEVARVEPLIGFIGLDRVSFPSPFTPAVEIGWRLAADHSRKGYATEGGRATLDFAFGRLGLDEIVALTAVANQRSRRVMERLGMNHRPDDDFDHPLLPSGHPLQRHVLYRLRAPAGPKRPPPPPDQLPSASSSESTGSDSAR